MISEYRFLKTKNHTYFAYVKIEAESLDSGLEIVPDFDKDSLDSSSDQYTPKIWIESATSGLKKAASIIFEKEKNVTGLQIKIKQIQWNFVDTTEDAVCCASALALLNLFPNIFKITEIFFDEKWKLKVDNEVISF